MIPVAASAAFASSNPQVQTGLEKPSDAVAIAQWVAETADNGRLPFIVVDKASATLSLYRPDGTLLASAPVLIGEARGDDSPPGIGDRKLTEIRPFERITPAGRFRASGGLDMSGKDVLWIDYDAAVALHRVPDPKPGMTAESRVRRLASATTSDNRASLGCVNVTTAFYDRYIVPFSRTTGIVYILPETRSIQAQFGMGGAVYAQATGDAAAAN